MKNNKGFTLIELIMVTIILGILAAVAVPRYMGTVNQAEAAAEKAVVDALRAAVENYSTQEFLENGRYDYPANPFDLVDVDGYDDGNAYSEGLLTGGDGSWAYLDRGSDQVTIYHQRRDNTVWAWDYSFADDCDGPGCESDDSGTNIGEVFEGNNQTQQNLQSDLSN
mgnify:CR=1 FL=1